MKRCVWRIYIRVSHHKLLNIILLAILIIILLVYHFEQFQQDTLNQRPISYRQQYTLPLLGLQPHSQSLKRICFLSLSDQRGASYLKPNLLQLLPFQRHQQPVDDLNRSLSEQLNRKQYLILADQLLYYLSKICQIIIQCQRQKRL